MGLGDSQLRYEVADADWFVHGEQVRKSRTESQGKMFANPLTTPGFPWPQDANMAKDKKKDRKKEPPGHFLRVWRQYREISQDELAQEIGTSKSVISQLESGVQGLTPKWLHKIAPVLRTTPGLILDADPNKVPRRVLEMFLAVAEDSRPPAEIEASQPQHKKAG